MKTNKGVFLILGFLLAGCSTPQYIPKASEIGTGTYGAGIRLFQSSGRVVSGELIAVDSSKIWFIADQSDRCDSVSMNHLDGFVLRYAKPDNGTYGWAIPLGLFLPVFHGLVASISIPVHALVTISVSASGEREFRFTDETLSFSKLNEYARFPQGIPKGIKPSFLLPAEKR